MSDTYSGWDIPEYIAPTDPSQTPFSIFARQVKKQLVFFKYIIIIIIIIITCGIWK
jgi:hypothetical protein